MTLRLQGYENVVKVEQGRLSSLFKARECRSQRPVLLQHIPLNNWGKNLCDRLYQEVGQLRAIDSDSVLKIYDHGLLDQNGDTALFLTGEDFAGIPLITMMTEFHQHLARTGEKNTRFCFYAIQMAEAVRDIHRTGLTHQGLNPHGFLFNSASRRLKLNGFAWEYAWRPAFQKTTNHHLPVDILTYIAPEQTARLNHDDDFRSNLYSLGIIFYEMLCGISPLPDKDSINIIYSHMARSLAPPAQIDESIHPAVSGLVMKLLAKKPDDRYQSITGLLHDLETLELKLDSGVDLSSFAVAGKDVRPVFTIPNRLYSREKEIHFLKKCYDRVTSGDSAVVMITGPPGVGKTALLREISEYVRSGGGIFLTGKFERRQQSVPIIASKVAVSSLVKWLLTKDSQKLAVWRDKIQSALSPNGRILTEIIPELELIIGRQPPVCELPPWEASARVSLVLEKFASLFLQPEHPLVFCLDDMQWSDRETLEYGLGFLLSKQRHYCLALGTFRDTEIGQGHPLADYIEKIQRTRIPYERLHLSSFDEAQTTGMVAGILEKNESDARPLSKIVHHKTGGNPFFIVQFMNSLHSSGLIHYDFEEGIWTYDLDRVARSNITDNVATLLADKISLLPDDTLRILQTAACVGNRLNTGLLSIVCRSDPARISACLAKAVEAGLLRIDIDSRTMNEPDTETNNDRGEDGGPTIEFAHDQIMQAVYQTIPAIKTRQLHYQIGRAMIRLTPPDLLQADIFDIVHQFERCLDLISGDAEKIELARLNLTAGTKAMEAVSFETAAGYLRLAANLLPEDSWQNQYDLTAAVYNRLAKCEFALGNPDESERLFEVLLKQAASTIDKANAYNAMVLLNAAAGRIDKALRLGDQGLRLFGLTIPADPGKVRLLYLLIKLRLLWGFRRVSTIQNAPLNTDISLNTALTLLFNIGVTAYYSDPRLCLWTNVTGCLLGIKETGRGMPLEHASFGLITLGAFLGSMFGFIRVGRGYAKIGRNLLKNYPYSTYQSIAYFVSAMFNRHWHEPARKNVDYFKLAYRQAFKMGDIMHACHSINAIFTTRMFLGDNLDDIYSYHQRHETFIRNSRLPFAIALHTVTTQYYMSLKGRTISPTSLNSNGYNLEQEYRLADNQGNGLLKFIILLMTLKQHVFFHDHEKALLTARKMRHVAHIPVGTLILTEYYFYSCLAAAAMLSRGTSRQQAGLCRRIMAGAIKKMRRWSRLQSNNFEHMLQLMTAEKEKVIGHPEKALRHYHRAIELAENGGFKHVSALACECAGRFFITRSDPIAAGAYLKTAEEKYSLWGASAKAGDMRKKYRGFPATPADNPDGLPFDQLDSKTIVAALQTISKEIEVRKLLTGLMHIVRESTGANRVVFMSNRNGELFVEVESLGDVTGQTLLKAEPLLNRQDTTLSSVVHYVKRTREMIVCNNLKNVPDFIQIDDTAPGAPQSLLCLPLIRQNHLVGILYLENSMTTGIFTTNRIEILKMIASQAAISFENATLYEHVIKDEQDLKTLSGKLRSLYSELILTEERERRRIATDLHDRIGHSLAAARIALESFRENPDTAHNGRLDDIAGIIEQTIADTRSLTFELSPPILYHLGLGAALDWLCEETQKKYGLVVAYQDLTENGATTVALDQKTGILCFQALRELMFNAVKHAQADTIRVTMSKDMHAICLVIEDDGIGFDAGEQQREGNHKNNGFGLFSVNERLRLIGGRLAIQSTPGRGTMVSMTVPCDSAEQSSQPGQNSMGGT